MVAKILRLFSTPQATIIGANLAQARKELQKPLTRRGVSLTAAPCTVELSPTATAAAVGPSLLSRTIEAALAFAAAKAVGGELVSAQVAALAKGMLHGMLATKLKIAVQTECGHFGKA